jgi:hypothetical protein
MGPVTSTVQDHNEPTCVTSHRQLKNCLRLSVWAPFSLPLRTVWSMRDYTSYSPCTQKLLMVNISSFLFITETPERRRIKGECRTQVQTKKTPIPSLPHVGPKKLMTTGHFSQLTYLRSENVWMLQPAGHHGHQDHGGVCEYSGPWMRWQCGGSQLQLSTRGYMTAKHLLSPFQLIFRPFTFPSYTYPWAPSKRGTVVQWYMSKSS